MTEDERKLESEIAANERWLSSFEAPAPSAEALERTRRAVRAELACGPSAGLARGRWGGWRGVAGVAAIIAVSVTVGWYSTRPGESRALLPDADNPLSVWLADANDELVRFARIDDGLSDLEEWSADEQWTATGASMYDALDGALEDESDGEGDQSGAMAPLQSGPRGLKVSHEIS